MEKLPIYKLTIKEINDGIDKISLVEYPAVESNFLYFSDDRKKKQVKFSIDNEEKRLVTGVLLRADYPIYRRNKNFEYYVVFDKETIVDITKKMLSDGTFEKFNLEHSKDTTGIIAQEIFIKDTERGINPKGFDDISDGSLFGTFYIDNDEVWKGIKEGTYMGMSIEGFFSPEEANSDDYDFSSEINEIIKLIEKIIK